MIETADTLTAGANASWSIKVSIAAQKFATSSIMDCKGSETTWELRMGLMCFNKNITCLVMMLDINPN